MATQCKICKNKYSLFSTWITKDKFYICSNCIRCVSRGDETFLDNLKEHSDKISIEDWKAYMKNPSDAQKWNFTDRPVITKIGDVLFDDNHKIISIPYLLNSRYKEYHYSQIYKYEYIENHKAISTGGSGIGRALVGGMLFGPAGAVVGAVTKKRTMEEVASNMSIRIIFLVNGETVIETIKISDFIDGNISFDSWTYERYIKRVEKLLHKLDDVYSSSHQAASEPSAQIAENPTQEHTRVGDINFRFSEKQSLNETAQQVWEDICAYLRSKENSVESYMEVVESMAESANSIATKTTNITLFNMAFERVSALLEPSETLLFFADDGLISHKAKVGYFVTDKHIFFLKKKKILTFDLASLFMIEPVGSSWRLNQSFSFDISSVPLNGLKEILCMSIIMALILQLHANIVGPQNSILIEGDK